jgi:hypothetical protein
MKGYRGRRSIRLLEYDCALPGGYFVTICTLDRACLFGSIENGYMALSSIGEVVSDVGSGW